jgi:hypothetical protein
MSQANISDCVEKHDRKSIRKKLQQKVFIAINYQIKDFNKNLERKIENRHKEVSSLPVPINLQIMSEKRKCFFQRASKFIEVA